MEDLNTLKLQVLLAAAGLEAEPGQPCVAGQGGGLQQLHV